MNFKPGILSFVFSQAVFFPGRFRKIEQSYYSEITLLVGVLLGLFDAALWFALSPPTRMPNCGTSGCFVSDQFRYYWGISNMVSIREIETIIEYTDFAYF